MTCLGEDGRNKGWPSLESPQDFGFTWEGLNLVEECWNGLERIRKDGEDG